MRLWTRRALRGAVLLAWLVLIADVTPLGDAIAFEAGRLALAAAGVGTVAILLRRHSAPAVAMFEAGRALGRTETATGVVAIRERHLWVVDSD